LDERFKGRPLESRKSSVKNDGEQLIIPLEGHDPEE